MKNSVRFHIFFVLFMFVLSMSVSSCTKDSEPDSGQSGQGPAFRDLLSEFDRADKFIVTRSIDLTQEPFNHLITGWTEENKNGMWADGLESSLVFFWKKREPLTLDIECRPYLPAREKKQTISVHVNGQFVETIELEDNWLHYRVQVPQEILADGDNDLKFVYGYVENVPKAVWRPDFKRSAAFRKIQFASPHQTPFNESSEEKITLSQNKISQPPDTFLIYHEKLSESSSLEIHRVNSPKDITSYVSVKSDSKPSQLFQFDTDGIKRMDLSGFADDYVQITLWSESKIPGESNPTETNHVQWSAIRLIAGVSEPAKSDLAKKPSLQKKQLKNLDVIYVVLDAFDAKHASLYGYERETTPFFKRLASDAVVFDHMFANAPYTIASVGTLFTSRYSHRHGLIKKEDRLDMALPNINQVLSGNGIDTILITDHPFFKKRWGLTAGFSTIHNKDDVSLGVDQVITQLKKVDFSGGKQKFVYIHLIPPHGPYDPPEAYRIFMEKFPEAIEATSDNLKKIKQMEIPIDSRQMEYIVSLYDANILFADDIAKNIHDYLKDIGHLEKSILIFTSDHGEAFDQHGYINHGPMVFDEAIHVPFIMRFPENMLLGGKRIAPATSLKNIPHTLLEIFDRDNQDDFSGESILSLVNGLSPSEEYIYSESPWPNVRCLRNLRYKFIHYPWHQMVFDLQGDPGETENLIEKFRVFAGYHRQRVKPYIAAAAMESKAPDSEPNRLQQEVDQETLKKLKGLGYLK